MAVTGCFIALLYMSGLRADRGVGMLTEPVALSGGAGTPLRERAVNRLGLSPGSVSVLYRNHTAKYWALKFRHRSTQYRHARRVLMARPAVSEAINLAAVAYNIPNTTLWRKARCETGGTLSPYSKNRNSTASGLFQFLTSTWASTPYAGFSIWSPYANALAAGWMHARGRGGEWVCQ